MRKSMWTMRRMRMWGEDVAVGLHADQRKTITGKNMARGHDKDSRKEKDQAMMGT